MEEEGNYFEVVALVDESWCMIKNIPNHDVILGAKLFGRFFEISPKSMHTLYKYNQADIAKKDPKFLFHATRFVKMLDMVLDMLGPDLETVREELTELGASHGRFGCLPSHYELMGHALDDTLNDVLGEELYKPEVRDAWLKLYEWITGVMIEAGF